ncbi:hypothetical protein DRQ07_03405 [candidate division KSB1 bacterium]|nr:MAG: hypothetical protein DRQ07_03405 [candidate division KSB1 bacterium]
MVVRGLNGENEIKDLLGFYKKSFVKTPISYFEKRIKNDPYLIPADIRIAEIKGEISSSITVYRRKMWWKGEVIDFGGIGNVATLPDKRGQGLSSQLMNDSVKYMKELSLPISILFTGINKFYEKFNYFVIPAYQLKLKIADNNNSDFSVREFRAEDITRVMEIYYYFNKELRGPVYRDADYWKANLEFREENEIFLIAEKNGIIKGYIRIVPENEKGEIWEFAYSEIEAFVALLDKCAKVLRKQEIKTAALFPKDIFKDAAQFDVSYEPSAIAMALNINDDIIVTGQKSTQEPGIYCFWWTDNF